MSEEPWTKRTGKNKRKKEHRNQGKVTYEIEGNKQKDKKKNEKNKKWKSRWVRGLRSH